MVETANIDDEHGVPFLIVYGISGNTHRFWSIASARQKIGYAPEDDSQINFADKIRCPIIVNIGLQDNVCPPETGYALFNRIRATDKQLYTYDGHGHDAGRSKHNAIVDRFFAQHLLSER